MGGGFFSPQTNNEQKKGGEDMGEIKDGKKGNKNHYTVEEEKRVL